MTQQHFSSIAAAAIGAMLAACAHADAVTEWNTKAGEIMTEAKMGTPPANRMMAIAQTAAYEAVNAITKRYPQGELKLDAVPGASVEAAVAAANRNAMLKLLPAATASIEKVYTTALANIPDGPGKTAGIAVGEQAASAVLAARANDGAGAAESYRPHTTAGAYVPTTMPAAPHWGQRRPWLMASPTQVRPGPPPALTSDAWARDFNELKMIGAKSSARRSAEQTEVAAFWEATLPPIYHGLVRSLADRPGREITRNALLYASAAQAMDDALIAVFDAKYHYNFWRPTTAIRNADIDGNAVTERDASWLPMVDSPMHPEYPSGHTILAGAVSTVLQADMGPGHSVQFTTTSPTAKAGARSWRKLDDFVAEVGNARVWEGVHWRFSTEVGAEMGRQIGALAVQKMLKPAQTSAYLNVGP